MINLFDEIINLTGVPPEILNARYRYVNIGGETCYIEQHKGVHSIAEEEIVINLNKAKLIISGTGLKIKYISKSDMVVIGKISGIKTI